MKKFASARVRLLVMLAALALAAVGYFTALGLGNVCGVGFDTITLICPLGALLSLLAQRTATPLSLWSVAATVVVCVVLGRVFCGWLCPVGFMVHRKGARKRHTAELAASPAIGTRRIKLDSRHAVLVTALVTTLLLGFPVFCLVCPVGLTFALVLLVARLFVFGETTWTIILFVAVIVAEVVLLPNWCRNFCPLGAVMSLTSGLNRTFRPQVAQKSCIRSQGRACDACYASCPEGIDLHNLAAGKAPLSECTKCRACADTCPHGAITFPLLSHAPKED